MCTYRGEEGSVITKYEHTYFVDDPIGVICLSDVNTVASVALKLT